MPRRDVRVTKYIAAREAFARPLLRRLRTQIHDSDRRLQEDLKWGMPTFLLDGRIVCGIAGFKGHCALWFWKGKSVVAEARGGAMGQFGRITSPADLPSASRLRALVTRATAQLDTPGRAGTRTARRTPRRTTRRT